MENIYHQKILLFASNVIRNHVSAFLFTTASNQTASVQLETSQILQ